MRHGSWLLVLSCCFHFGCGEDTPRNEEVIDAQVLAVCDTYCQTLQACGEASNSCQADCLELEATQFYRPGCLECVGQASCDSLDSCSCVRTIALDLVGAVVGPGKSDGTGWDSGEVPEEAWSALAQATTGDPAEIVSRVLQAVSSSTIGALSKPDVKGTANVNIDGWYDPGNELTLDAIEDNFQPVWTSGNAYINLSLKTSLRLRVTLVDEDVLNHDPIGTVELTAQDIRAALAAGTTHSIFVGDQTPNRNRPQILIITISVREQR
ncbi:MAG: hypothetical protein RBU37_21600 [Myxococcota bacterium]|jgi:hypothetical protein|nr:hypothetical protein [Myxococcota bacterium]